ncbi:MAG: hypothetical protein HY707_12225 [Ignavibacteriae bacterium]|nr:hypothetical protein [Ignavibacteriota bacterium]
MKKKQRNRMIIIIGGIALGIVVAKYAFTDEPSAPPGKVWSPEHQHWHDIRENSPITPPVNQPTNTNPQNGNYFPQPLGPVPAGKVWSTEHGHWHDIEGNSSIKPPVNQPPNTDPQNGNYFPQPPGPVPAGKVWSTEHGHWHNVQ